jgi:ankyrin repeat protein
MEAVDEPGEYFGEAQAAIVVALLDAGADVHARDEHSMTALHYAAIAEARATELLLSRGADPNATADDGTTPLHECATYGGAAAARALISAGADIARRNLAGETPLDIARREHSDPGEAPELFRLPGGG